MISAAERQSIVAEAKTWLGTPWHHQASLKGVGVDCAMFIRAVYMNCKIVSRCEVFHYPEQWALHRSDEHFCEMLQRYGKETTEKLPGNIVIFKYGRCYSHGGIVIEWPTIIHAVKKSMQVIYEDMSCSPLRLRDHKFYEVG